MIKNIIFLTIFIFSQIGFSQLSNKHWIPPLHSRDITAIQDHYIYLSTPETTPFTVTITDGLGTPITGSPFTISATSPVSVLIGNGSNTKMFVDISRVNTVLIDRGLILEGSKDFYVSFRMRHTSHAETLISKGISGKGKNFRVGYMINDLIDSRKSFVTSLMATEDGTSVSLTGYDTNVTFATSSGVMTLTNQSFFLDAGESIIFSGYSNNPDNIQGAIGALISSNKDIVVNSGNALGGVQNGRGDFAMDQIVSSSQIGTEYIFIEGNGTPDMEKPLIIAHEDNTEVYVNNISTPIAVLNAGQYIFIPNTYYQGINNSNLYVRSSKPVFAYQPIGGGFDTATSGLNFIPPLSCFFQNSVIIPAVNRIGGVSYTADLMILTYASSSLTVNGVPIPLSDAQNVLGNSDWVTYRVRNVFGDANIVSTGPLAAGVFGYLDDTAGYAGYYSGFGSNPQPTAVTICSNQTINLFDAIIGNPGENGTWTVPSGGSPLNNNIFDPSINIEGEYIYSFTKDCNSSPIPVDVAVSVTIQQANNAGNNNSISVCKSDPSFDLFPLLGTNVTPNGTWAPALASGTSVFNPAVDVSGNYVYTIPNSGVCSGVSATISVTNNALPLLTPISDFKKCDDNIDGDDTNGIVTFNLLSKTNEILNSQTGINVTYHELESEALLGINAITTINTSNRIIYVRLTNATTNCFVTSSFNLIVTSLPVIASPIILKQCDTDTDAITSFNLNEANNEISSQPNLVFTYHTSLPNAISGTAPITNPTDYISANNGRVWARIVNENGCFRTSEVNLIVSTTVINLANPYLLEECDDYLDASDPNADGYDYFNLSTIDNLITQPFPLGQSYTVTYYETENDALQEVNEIPNITNYRNITAYNQTLWVRIDSNLNNDCVGLGPYLKLIVNPLPIIDLGVNFTLCLDPITGIGSQIVDATPTIPGNYSYLWTPANPNGDSPLFDITAAGTYSVVVTNNITNCSETDTITATFSSEPQSVFATLLTPAFSTGLAAIEVTAVGGFGEYEYSLNAIDWQSSPIFTDLPNGSYSVYVRDIQGCGLLQTNLIQTINYNNYFTPNNDGYNDKWNIYLPESYEGVIHIYDRYGKLLKQISPYGEGWDGTYNGNILPSTDYWFKVEYVENNIKKEFKSHFSLKR